MSRKFEDEKEDESTMKWSCWRCTYDNWPRSIKCTICCAQKPSALIMDQSPSYEERHIYRIAPLIVNKGSSADTTNTSKSGSNNSISSYSKWTCPLCTYQNWIKSIKCTQCLAARRPASSRSPSPNSTASSALKSNQQPPSTLSSSAPSAKQQQQQQQQHQQQPRENQMMNLNQNQGAVAGSIELTAVAEAGMERHSPPLSTFDLRRTFPLSADTYHNDRNSRVVNNSNHTGGGSSGGGGGGCARFLSKWTCAACTYENWPRSTKCVMCATGRSRTPGDLPAFRGGAQTDAHQMDVVQSESRMETSSPSPPHRRRVYIEEEKEGMEQHPQTIDGCRPRSPSGDTDSS